MCFFCDYIHTASRSKPPAHLSRWVSIGVSTQDVSNAVLLSLQSADIANAQLRSHTEGPHTHDVSMFKNFKSTAF